MFPGNFATCASMPIRPSDLNGLVSKLVLRKLDQSSRIVIVPDGPVDFRKYHDHVRINIDTGEDQIQHHQFLIDSQLRRLVDNGSLRSRLFKIYLHAVTSYYLPDILTGRTGTEEALECLAQASTQSFMAFDNHEAELLKNLARLSPSRKYYPKHLKTMETVTWRKFPALQQHDRFFELVESIKARAASVQVFQQSQNSTLQLDMPRKFPELYMRAKIRLSNIRVDGYGAEDFTTNPIFATLVEINPIGKLAVNCRYSQFQSWWTIGPRKIQSIAQDYYPNSNRGELLIQGSANHSLSASALLCSTSHRSSIRLYGVHFRMY